MSQLTRDERSDHEDEEEDERSTTEEEAEKKHKVGNGLAELDKSGCFGCLSPPEELCRSKTVRWLLERLCTRWRISGAEQRETLFSRWWGRKDWNVWIIPPIIEDEPESEELTVVRKAGEPEGDVALLPVSSVAQLHLLANRRSSDHIFYYLPPRTPESPTTHFLILLADPGQCVQQVPRSWMYTDPVLIRAAAHTHTAE